MQGQRRHAPVPAKMRALWLALLRQLYPNRCPVCDRVLFDAWICPSCDAKLKYVSQPVCFQCGKPLESSIQEYCSDCQKGRHHFIQGRAVFCYQGAVRGMLYRYKYAGRRDYSEFFAVQAAKRYADWARQRGIEMVLPIPLSKKRKRRRGYNQAEMFAKKFSELAGLPFDAKLLVRTRDTLPQKRLSARERKNNLKNAFKIEENVVEMLHTVYDPEIPVDIYELGLVYKIDLDDDGNLVVDMTLTAPNCPMADFILEDVRMKLESVDGVKSVVVNIVFEPEWTQDMMSEEAKLELGLL